MLRLTLFKKEKTWQMWGCWKSSIFEEVQNSEENSIFYSSINMFHNEANASTTWGFWLAERDEGTASPGFCLAYGNSLFPSLVSAKKNHLHSSGLQSWTICQTLNLNPCCYISIFLIVWVLILSGSLRNPHFSGISLTWVYYQWSKWQEFLSGLSKEMFQWNSSAGFGLLQAASNWKHKSFWFLYWFLSDTMCFYFQCVPVSLISTHILESLWSCNSALGLPSDMVRTAAHNQWQTCSY